MGREPRSSTLNTHNSALNRIFDEAVARGYMNKSQVPVLVNKTALHPKHRLSPSGDWA